MTGEQLLLPFDDEAKENQEVPTLPHFDNPQNDNERLLEFQFRFKTYGDKTALTAMYVLGCVICEKYINAESTRNRHIKRLTVEERKEKASDAVNYVISSYLRKPEWFITKSLPAYLYKRVQHELYYRTKAQELVDFVDLNEFFKNGEEDDFDDDWEES